MRRPIRDRPSIVEPRARVDACDFVDQRDAILDRADRRAEVAADAFAFVDNELALAVDDAVAAALNAGLLMWLSSCRVAFPPTARSGPSPRRPEPRVIALGASAVRIASAARSLPRIVGLRGGRA